MEKLYKTIEKIKFETEYIKNSSLFIKKFKNELSEDELCYYLDKKETEDYYAYFLTLYKQTELVEAIIYNKNENLIFSFELYFEEMMRFNKFLNEA